MDSLKDFCGLQNQSFQVWNSTGRDFGSCFEYLAVICPTNIFLLFTSAYFVGKRPRIASYGLAVIIWVKLRIALSCLIVLAPLVEIVCSLTLESFHPPVFLLTNSLICLTWIINTFAVWRLRHLYLIKKCLPPPLLVATLLVFLTSIIQVYSVFKNVKSPQRDFNNSYHGVKEYGTAIRSFLLVLYLVSLVQCHDSRGFAAGGTPAPHLNETGIQAGDEGERRDLLRSLSRGTFYSSTQCVSDDLGVAEDPYNYFSKFLFWWVKKIMLKGYQGHIQSAEDLYLLPRSLRTSNIQEIFFKELYYRKKDYCRSRPETLVSRESYSDFDDGGSDVEVQYAPGNADGDEVFESRNETVKRSLLAALHYSFGPEYYCLGVLKLLGDALGFAGPLLLHALVSYMENRKEPTLHGYYYATGLFISTLISAFINTHFSYMVNKVGLKMRAAIITTVYQKALFVSMTSLSKFSTGEVVNYMSTDTDRVVNFCPSFHQFWSLPFQIAVSLYLLYKQVGLAFLAGLGFAIILIPINRWLAIKIQALSKDMMVQKDRRVKMMNEILYGIRVIKFNAWERNFESKVNELRSAELKSLKGRKYLDAWCVYFWATTPVIISILTFMTYVLMENKLTAAKVFTSVALFNMLISPLNAFPWVLNGLVEAWVSVQRLQAFLGMDDLDLRDYYIETPAEESRHQAIKIVNGTFSWRYESKSQKDEKAASSADRESGSPTAVECLSDINLTLRKTTCHCLEYPLFVYRLRSVAHEKTHGYNSKKDTLQTKNLILKRMTHGPRWERITPKGELVGVIGTVGSGKSSLLSAIAAEMDKQNGQVYVSCLDSGLGLAAQEPWIQHATVKENILFGQPFDVEKYSEVIDACALREDLRVLPAGNETEVGENGVTLSGGQKARVSLARAVYQDKDVYLLDDPLAAVDAHVAAHIFKHCILGLLSKKTVILCTHHTKYLKAADLVVVMDRGRISHQGIPAEILTKETVMSQLSHDEDNIDLEKDGFSEPDKIQLTEQMEGDGGLVTEEEKDAGAVKLHVYWSYWLAIGRCLATSILISLLLMQASRNLSDWWLAYWISHTKSRTNGHDNNITSSRNYIASYITDNTNGYNSFHIVKDTVTFYLFVYGGFAVANTIFTLFRAFLFAYGGIRAAKVIHNRLLTSILAAPISFFDVTPIGRIVNRFSSDMYSVDDSLPFMLNIFLAQAYGVAGTIAITCYGLPWLLILLMPLSLIYYYIQNYYRRTSRELKRLMSVTLSPIYAHFSETLTGLSTIRALRETRRFQSTNETKLEINQRANFCAMAASQWLSLRLQLLGVAMVTAVAFIAVLEHHFSTVNPGLVGLAISYALSVTDRLSGMVTSFTETEKQMVSVERAVQYIENIPSEHSGKAKVSPFWPSIGQITFHKVVLIYREGLSPALREVSFQIGAGEKIGIVGRTGSGKSSLFLVLFRMVNLHEGMVIVDGQVISSVPLDVLRSRLAIIPQDPFLFSGSVRSNIDPWSKYCDKDLWITLERCHIRQAVRELGGLEADVGERGRNFSVGQRQLICLARALLTNAQILCIDEATASVDMETDELIQRTIREEFRESTVLTIAHRVETVLDSDRVLVMDRGLVAEFDRPDQLLAKRNSLFYSLVYGS